MVPDSQERDSASDDRVRNSGPADRVVQPQGLDGDCQAALIENRGHASPISRSAALFLQFISAAGASL
jgi:hypothetical protein